MRSPVEVVNAVFAALNSADWAGLAELCDPVSLRAFKREILDEFPDTGEGLSLDIESLMEAEPDLPREVAEYQLAQMNKYMDPGYRLESQLHAVSSVEQLRGMDPGRVFARWLQARSPENFRQNKREAGEQWELPEPQDQSRKATRAYRYTALGSVLDSSEVAYVVYRKSAEVTDIYPGLMDDWAALRPADEVELARVTHFLHTPRVATCRKQADGTWRIVADSSLLLTGTLQVVEIRRD
ncbi:MAG: hypothetical protein ACR2GK_05465 [Gemmatimonadaceae bacterium]